MSTARVILYTDSLGIGGAELSLAHLVSHLSGNWEIIVAGMSATVVNHIAGSLSQIQKVIFSDHHWSGFHHWHIFHHLNPQIIHFNCCTPWANAMGLTVALSLPQTRIVKVEQLPLRTTDALTLWRTRVLCLRVDAHVAVGETSARRMEDFYALGRRSILSIPNGVPDQFLPVQPPVQPPVQLSALAHSRLKIGSIGRLDAMKGHDILLQAVAQVDDVDVTILGEGSQRSALEQLAQELQISDRVHLKGWVDQPRHYLPAFDVVVLPSRSEGFPLAMIEAMLAARPVIATRVGSMPEAVMDGKTGLLIDKDDVAGLAQALIQLRDQPILRMQMGQNGRELALANWTVEAMTRQYEQLWQQLLITPVRPRLRVPRPKD
jgi:glycosyltransferase involved in cell wall biosynthesis